MDQAAPKPAGEASAPNRNIFGTEPAGNAGGAPSSSPPTEPSTNMFGHPPAGGGATRSGMDAPDQRYINVFMRIVSNCQLAISEADSSPGRGDVNLSAMNTTFTKDVVSKTTFNVVCGNIRFNVCIQAALTPLDRLQGAQVQHVDTVFDGMPDVTLLKLKLQELTISIFSHKDQDSVQTLYTPETPESIAGTSGVGEAYSFDTDGRKKVSISGKQTDFTSFTVSTTGLLAAVYEQLKHECITWCTDEEMRTYFPRLIAQCLSNPELHRYGPQHVSEGQLQNVALAGDEQSLLSRAPRPGGQYGRQFRFEPAQGVDVTASSFGGWQQTALDKARRQSSVAYTLTSATSTVAHTIQKLLERAKHVGAGGHDQTLPDPYDTLKIITVQSIQNNTLDAIYNAHHARLVSKKCSNERLLFHCSRNDALESVLRNGFSPAYTVRAAYGKGVYFADNMGKCDQYASPHTSGPFKGVCTMLLCKVDLGCSLSWANDCRGDKSKCFPKATAQRTLIPLPDDPSETYDSVILNAAQLSAQTGNTIRFNEYMLPAKSGSNGAIPIAIIAYKRTAVGTPRPYVLFDEWSNL